MGGVQRAEYYVELAESLGDEDKHDEAEQALLQALRLDPSLSKVYFNLGVSQALQGNNVDAERSFRRFTSEFNEVPMGYFQPGPDAF